MNSLVVYFSKFGNTRSLAEAIAETLGSAGSVQVRSPDQLADADLQQADLVVMGSPTHKMNLPESVRSVVGTMPKGVLRNKAVAAFDTSYKMSWWLNPFTASKRLNRRLRKLGGRPLVPPEIFLVTGREGPLNDGEISLARAWAEAILEVQRESPRQRSAGEP